MVLGLAAFVLLSASALLGGLMLITTVLLSASRKWRRQGLLALCAGLSGALFAALGLAALAWLSEARVSAEAWLLFACAGFGWGAFGSLAFYAVIIFFKQPNRWIDRRRSSL
jgi:hypothetical protein